MFQDKTVLWSKSIWGNWVKPSETHSLYSQPSPRLSDAKRRVGLPKGPRVQPFSSWSDHRVLSPRNDNLYFMDMLFQELYLQQGFLAWGAAHGWSQPH